MALQMTLGNYGNMGNVFDMLVNNYLRRTHVNYVEVDKNQNFHTEPNIWLTSYNDNKHNEE